jgi:uncharacterized protein YacL
MLLLIIRILYLGICAGVLAAYIEPATRQPWEEPLNPPVSPTGQPREEGAGPTDDGFTEQTGAAFAQKRDYPEIVVRYPALSFCVMLAITQTATLFDMLFRRKRIEAISAVYFGLFVGVVLAYSLIQALIHAFPKETVYYPLVVMFPLLMIPFVCVTLILQTKDNFRFAIPYVEFQRELRGSRPLVVDSSSLIDGRIADVIETEIIESELIVPDFVLAEVQEIADSPDKNRRLRGRRGLDILERLQAGGKVGVRVHEDRSADHKGMTVDQRLVALAQELGGAVITNDFNLNKVASVQGISVVNLNDLANALKSRYIPGERLQIRVMKQGESNGQGVGYLDDGTMVVCENADHLIGERLSVTVTSVLQKSEGRMIFGKPSDQTDA